MAASKKKGRSKQPANAAYLGEGLRTLMGWVLAVVSAGVALATWFGRWLWGFAKSEQAKQAFGLVLGAFSIFLFVALLDYKAGAPLENVCGSMGYTLAHKFLRFLGVAAFLPPLFGAFWGIARLLREELENGWVKLFGVVALTLTTSVSAYGLDPDRLGSRSFPGGWGGSLGSYAFPQLQANLGPFGVAALLALITIVSFLLATELAFVPFIRSLLQRAGQGLHQPDLPLAPEQSTRSKKPERTEKSSSWWGRAWESVMGMFRPFHPGEEALLAPAGASAGNATKSTKKKDGASKPKKSRSIPLLGLKKNKSADAETAVEESPKSTQKPDEESEEEWAEEYEEDGGEYAEGEYEEGEYDEEYEDGEYEEGEYEDGEWEEDYEEGEYGEDYVEGEDEDGEWEEDDSTAEKEFTLPGISASEADTVTKPAAKKKTKKTTRAVLKQLPKPELLKVGVQVDQSRVRSEIDSMGRRLQDVFDAFGLDAKVVGAERGPTLTLFEVQLASGVSVKKLKNQRDDLGVALGSHGVRIVYPLPGRTTVGIEVPNLKRETVLVRDVFDEMDTNWKNNKLPMVLGRDTLGKPATEDLTAMPHMLVAGTTGSGKSVCLNSILCSWLLTRTPDQLRLVLIDPKQVELQLYKDIPHLLCPVVTDMKRAPFTLEWATRQMEDRLHMFKLAGVRNIADYNSLKRKGLKERLGDEYDASEFPDNLPYIVLVIDELADLMLVSAKEVEIAISRLAAKARAAGIHLLVATQRPSTDVVTGLIKMNLPVRLAFKVTSSVDSRVILDDSGADDLLGNGDFLYRPPGASGMIRGQGAFVSEKEVRAICDFLRKNGKPEFLEELVQMKGPAGSGEVDDPLYEDAVRIILQSGRGSASLLQRALSIGYTRASRLVDIMSEQGVLGPHTGSKAREILLTLEEWEAQREQG